MILGRGAPSLEAGYRKSHKSCLMFHLAPWVPCGPTGSGGDTVLLTHPLPPTGGPSPSLIPAVSKYIFNTSCVQGTATLLSHSDE